METNEIYIYCIHAKFMVLTLNISKIAQQCKICNAKVTLELQSNLVNSYRDVCKASWGKIKTRTATVQRANLLFTQSQRVFTCTVFDQHLKKRSVNSLLHDTRK